MTIASKFYGNAYNSDRAEQLDKAVKYLDMAIRAEANGEGNKIDMAFNAAVKAEAAAFAVS